MPDGEREESLYSPKSAKKWHIAAFFVPVYVTDILSVAAVGFLFARVSSSLFFWFCGSVSKVPI